MAWWPFGKKKAGEEGEAPAKGARTPGAGRPDVPLTDDPPGFDPGAPQLLPGDEDGAGGVTLQVPPPPGAVMGAAPSPDDPFGGGQPGDHFAQTLEDPEASANLAAAAPPSADPFAPAQPRDHFAATIEDSDHGSVPPPSLAAALGADPFGGAGVNPGGDPFGAPAGDPFGAPAFGAPGYGPGPLPPSSEMPTLYAPAGVAAADPFGAGLAAPTNQTAAPAGHDFSTAAPTIQLGPGAAAAAYEDPPDAHEATTPLAFSGAPGLFAPPPPAAAPHAGFPPPAPAPTRETRPAPATPNPPQPRMPSPSEESSMAANPMNASASLSADKRRLGLALLAGGPITHERLLLELDRSGKSSSVLGKALLQSNFAREEELLAVLVARVRIPKINVKNTKIPLDTIRLLPADVARRTKTLPIEKIGDILVVVSPDIGDETALTAVRQATGCLISPIQCAPEGFDEILEGYYERLGSAPPASPSPDLGAPAAAPEQVAASAPSPAGVVAALPADEGAEDSWDRVYSNMGPIPAEDALL